MDAKTTSATITTCYHCRQPCEETVWFRDRPFCCYGCRTVYEILSDNDLCEYYNLDQAAGVQLNDVDMGTYECLDEKDVRKNFIEFESGTFARTKFNIPSIHCVSCIWLLENLHKIEPAVIKVEVNFARKFVTIDFNPEKILLSTIGKRLALLGYAPQINLDHDTKEAKNTDRTLILKLAIAGFCFGNVMLFSFPEYLGLDAGDEKLKTIFSWLNVALSLPAFLYSGSSYLQSAWNSFKQKHISIDVPIAAGLVTLFARSNWDIIMGLGPGYFDSLTGLIFFLLIGRWFQSKTYESLAFDRDFKSYFPLAVQRLMNGEWKPAVIYNLEQGDQIRIRNMEIIPTDSFLRDNEAFIDYSFVTGESKPLKVRQNDLVYAGGRLVGAPVNLVVDKKTSQSHLTSLWNNQAFHKDSTTRQRSIDSVAAVFTWAVVIIALLTAAYWSVTNPAHMWLNLTAVLIVACPCALALAAPFTYGNMMRAFGRNDLYLKNADVIEKMATIDAIVFDKTGTVTHGYEPEIKFVGVLYEKERAYIKSLTSFSTHPLSNLISTSIESSVDDHVQEFRELPGKGIEGWINGLHIKLGSAVYLGIHDVEDFASRVFVSIDGKVRGYFRIKTSLRRNIHDMVHRLSRFSLSLISGDHVSGRNQMENIFPDKSDLHFDQSPHDKLNFIKKLQQQGKHVMMVGDGLNDAGALQQSDVGIAVTDDTGVFTPASDGILKGDKIGSLDIFLGLAKSAVTILKAGFIISFLYNAIAISFAAMGHLTPLMAAVLMPLSSITVVGFTSLAVNWVVSKKLNVHTKNSTT